MISENRGKIEVIYIYVGNVCRRKKKKKICTAPPPSLTLFTPLSHSERREREREKAELN